MKRNSSLSELLSDYFIIVFASWTVICNIVIFYRGSFLTILIIAGAAVTIAILCSLICKFKRSVEYNDVIPDDAIAPKPADSHERINNTYSTLGALACSIFIVFIYKITNNIIILWLLSVAWLGLTVSYLFAKKRLLARPILGKGENGKVIALAAISLVITLFTMTFGTDDCFYVNTAVAAADNPHETPMTRDTIQGIEGLDSLAIYRINSLPLLAAAFSLLLWIPAIYIQNLAFPLFFALLLVAAHAELFKRLCPQNWFWLTLVSIFMWFYLGGGIYPHTEWSYLHLQMGKSVVLTALMPLTIAYALDFISNPSIKTWLMLAAVQVACIGMNPTALYITPVIAAISLAAGTSFSKKSLLHFATGLLASTYVLAAGFAVREGSIYLLDQLNHRVPRVDSVALVAGTLEQVLGGDIYKYFAIFCFLSAWAFARHNLTRMFLATVPLALLLFFLNPGYADWVAENIAGSYAFWRVFWLLPVPMYITFVSVSGISLLIREDSRPPHWRNLLVIALIAIPAIIVLPPGPAVDEFLKFKAGLKMPEPEFSVAAALNEAVPAGSVVAAPRAVTVMVPMFHHHAYPVFTKPQYLIQSRPVFGRSFYNMRLFMIRFLDKGEPRKGKEVFDINLFEERLDLLDVKAVCFRSGIGRAQYIRPVLLHLDFKRLRALEGYEIWAR